ncbi:MAG: hypothetical protein KC800_13530 [Candidatus Eremiobacteraeota bacterium]|nr:hypothetical protein [Candidatus Eremiobacteraeota bacterium]
MKVYEQPGYTTVCGTPSEWKQLKKHFDGEAKVSVLDIRTATEEEQEKLDKAPDTWLYRRLPIGGKTISEQDVDVFRREQRRHGKLIVVTQNLARSALLVHTDLARIERKPLDDSELDALDGLQDEKALREWLDAYLERHQTVTLPTLEGLG